MYKPADFNHPLIRSLGRLSCFQSDKSCYLPDVFQAILKDMKIESMESFGMIANGKQTKVASWVGYSFDNVRRQGFAILPRRKRWALTPEGVTEAKRLCEEYGDLPALQTAPEVPEVAEIETPTEPTEPTTPVTNDPPAAPEPVAPTVPAPSQGALPGLEQVEATPEEVAGPLEVETQPEPEEEELPDYMNDPAIKESIITGTKCFGYEVGGHALCKKCYISPECRVKKFELLVEVARKVARKEREEEAKRQREEKEEEHRQRQEAADSFIENLPAMEVAGMAKPASDTLTSIAPSQALDGAKVIIVSADSLCVECGGRIAKDEKAKWVMDIGLYHPNCAK